MITGCGESLVRGGEVVAEPARHVHADRHIRYRHRYPKRHLQENCRQTQRVW